MYITNSACVIDYIQNQSIREKKTETIVLNSIFKEKLPKHYIT